MPATHPSTKRTAFTLVELMVSIALALLLLVGVNQVFKTTTATVGTGYATSQVMREHMAVEKSFGRDFEKAAGPSQMPAIIIHSQQIYAFRDRNDFNADADGKPETYDPLNPGKTPEPNVEAADYGLRSHRVDTISFFAKDIDDPFRRVTGDQSSTAGFVSSETSSEAYIWIGHLRLPNNSANPNPAHSNLPPIAVADSTAAPTGEYFDPGQATPAANPNNYFANDWALGHQAILLKAAPTGDYISGAGSLSPISKNSTANITDPVSPTTGSAAAWAIPQSRLDIARTTLADYHDKVDKAELPLAVGGTPGSSGLPWAGPGSAVDSLDYRFNGKPWMTKPTSSTAANYQQILTREMALTTPFLFRGCTQFMVEFAGDFITQDNDPTSVNYGKFRAAQPDGVLDFYRDGNKVRRTRWYGFPRDTSSSSGTSLPANNGAPDGHITANYDVVPVRDVAGTTMPFEKVLPTAAAVDYGRLNPGALGPNAQYLCAWGPKELNPSTGSSMRPWMIRLVLQLTDQNGRLGDGQVVEYVYTLPQY